jgi:hypothetical protein
MRASIENRYKMTRDVYLDWVKHPIPERGKKRISTNFIWVGFSVIALYLSLKGFTDGEYVVAACFFLLALISIFSVFFMTRFAGLREFRKMAKFQGADEWERVIRFSDEVTFQDGGSKSRFSYDMFTELVKTGDYLALRLNRGLYLRLWKNGFKSCPVPEFIEFIKHKNPNIKVREAQ